MATAPDFAAELAEMLNDGVDDMFTPSPPARPAYGSWNEDDKQFPAVKGQLNKSSFPIKDKLKALGCKWSAQRNAWIAPTPAVHAQGERLLNDFWAANPNHDPWTPEGALQPQRPLPPAAQGKRGRVKAKANGPVVTITAVQAGLDDGVDAAVQKVSDAFAAMNMAQVLAKTEDAQLVRELEKRGYVVRKLSTAELLAEQGVSAELLDETRRAFDELDAIESELDEEEPK